MAINHANPEYILGTVPAEGAEIDRQLIRGGAWMIASRWTVRSLGLLSTFILARLLTPSDFGIIAMAMVVIGFLELVSYGGQSSTLVRIRYLTREHLDTAWTMQVLLGIAAAAVVLVTAPIAANIVDDPRVDPVLTLLSLAALVTGLTNPGVVAFRVNFQFAKEFRLGMYEKLGTIGLTLPLAFFIQSYWALAISVLAGKVLHVALSYSMHPYRPWFCLRRIYEIWSYSFWIVVTQVADFVTSISDSLVAGNRAGTTAMGHYTVAYGVATMPVLELVQPTWRGILPVYASVAEDATCFKRTFLDVLAVAAMLAVPLSVGCSTVAADFVRVALGAQWVEAIPLVRVLALSAMAVIFGEAMFVVINVGLRPRQTAYFVISRLALLVPAMIVGYAYGGLLGIAIARTVLMFAFLPLIFVGLNTVMQISVREVATCLSRPVFGAATMVCVLWLVHPSIPDIPLVRLPAETAIGAISYAAAVSALWVVAGRPPGPERFFWERIANFTSRRRLRRMPADSVGERGSDA